MPNHTDYAHLPIYTPATLGTPAARRAAMAPLTEKACAALGVPAGVSIAHRTVHAEGRSIRLRHYAPDSEMPVPAVVYFHGGGFTVGSLDAAQAVCLGFVSQVGCAVFSVEYRLAPEHPYPAAPEDGYAALIEVAARRAEWNLSSRIAVAGTSAGGAIAASVAQIARDRSGPELCFQLLSCPMLDDRLETHSARQYSSVPVYSRFQAELSWRAYLGSPPGTAEGYAAPARTEDLRGLPPAYLLAAGLDPLRDEAIDYASRLMLTDLPVELRLVPGVPHGFDVVAPDAALSRSAISDMHRALKAALFG